MARLARLALAAQRHYVIQRGHDGSAIVRDDEDRRALLEALRVAADTQGCRLHAYAIGETEIHLLLSPDTDQALSRTMQALGRRYGAAFNRRHGRSGTLWDGRFRAAVIEPGPATLLALRLIDSAGALPGAPQLALFAVDSAETTSPGSADPDSAHLRTSAAHRLGLRRDPSITDLPEDWQLGNTPFEREARYRELLADAVGEGPRTQLRQAVLRGWAYGTPSFIEHLAEQTARPLQPRRRGRPRKGA